jgi:hypothetical protein
MDRNAAIVVERLEALIDTVEDHIGEQRIRMFTSLDVREEEEVLRDMLNTLERLQAYRDRFLSTVH